MSERQTPVSDARRVKALGILRRELAALPEKEDAEARELATKIRT